MKTVSLLFILLPVIIVGCAQSPKGPEWVEEEMYTLEADLPSSAVAGEPVIFTLRSWLPNSCWKFSHIRINSSGYDVFVTAYMKRSPEDLVCLTVVTPVAEEGAYIPVFAGEYRFHFWRSDTLSLDYTVIAQ
jgi:hypothetical protein